jgi:DNA-binding transcriptional regulator YiaG
VYDWVKAGTIPFYQAADLYDSICAKFWRARRKIETRLTIYKHYAYSRLLMTARGFKAMRLKKNYSQSQLAREFDVDVGTISRWEREEIKIPRLAELALSSLKPKQKTRKAG